MDNNVKMVITSAASNLPLQCASFGQVELNKQFLNQATTLFSETKTTLRHA